MKSKIKFSVLIPSIPSRIEKFLIPLYEKLQKQLGERTDVEILCLLDNKKRSIGLKRDALVRISRGEYFAFVDDDDDVSDDYIFEICKAIEENEDVDVITFNQIASINNNKFIVNFSIENENEEAKQDEYGVYADINRKPFHICVWKSKLGKKQKFADCSYGEDWHWAERVLKSVKNQLKIDKVLHFYRYNDSVTEAEHTFPDCEKKESEQNEEIE